MPKEINIHTDYHLYKAAWINTRAPHLYSKLTKKECGVLLKKGGFMIRNTYDFDTNRETSFWYVIKDNFGGMEELSSNTRNQIRRAFKTLDIQMIDKDILLKQGYDVYTAAFEKYKGNSQIMSRTDYLNMIKQTPSQYEFWACFDKSNGNLIAYSMNEIVDDTCNYLSMKAVPEYLKTHYPYYGLLYAMNQYYLEEKKLMYVSDGARSITEHSNIQSFLISKFKFRNAYCYLQIKYKWWLNILLSMLYPFRNQFNFAPIKAILNMESMHRKSKQINLS